MPNQSLNWKAYFQSFVREARKKGHADEHIQKCLTYAKNLHTNGFPIIFSPKHFCHLVGYSTQYVMGVSNVPSRYYRTFSIPKKSGGKREISEPLPSLKEIQRWILDNILAEFPLSPHAKAFRKGYSIKSNARFHKHQGTVLTLDINDFFGNIHGGIVYNMFRSCGYQRAVATLLTNICVLDGSLPQGAPTSPAISNIAMTSFDRRMSSYCLKLKIRYTRYADDLTFSGEFDTGRLCKFAIKILSRLRLSINTTKTRILGQNNQQRVTGIVVNDYMQAPRATRRELRKSVYFIEKHGVSSHMVHEGILKSRYIEHLLGLANFILYVNPKDRDALHAREILLPILRERLLY